MNKNKMEINNIYLGDCLELSKKLEPESIDLIFFSPPYWNVHKYSESVGEIGHNQTYEEYIEALRELMDNCYPAMKPNGNMVINVMDLVRDNKQILISNDLFTESWLKPIQRIVWYIRNKMPVASDIRFVNKFEWLLHFAKDQKKYYFDKDPVREPHSHYAETDKRKWKWNSKGKCPGNMWDIPSYRVSGKNKLHIAGFPEALVERVIKTWCPEGGVVLDPFMGSGQTAYVAKKHNRNYIGFEISETYYNASVERLSK